MVSFYVRMVKTGKMTIDEVPEKFREDVKKALGM